MSGEQKGFEYNFALLLSHDIGETFQGLAAQIEEVLQGENPSSARRMHEVYERFFPYIETGFPLGTDVRLVRLFAISAGLGIWDTMDVKDVRMGEALLAYYGSDSSTLDLIGILGVTNEGTAGDLLRRGINYLWEHLDETSVEFPINKYIEFPLDELQHSRQIRQSLRAQERYQQFGRINVPKGLVHRRGIIHGPNAEEWVSNSSEN